MSSLQDRQNARLSGAWRYQGEPPKDVEVDFLIEPFDGNGCVIVPARWSDGRWVHSATGEQVYGYPLGWRVSGGV